ncbi:MAG: biotin/lipoyl-containing protein [Chloroflexota bacterium]
MKDLSIVVEGQPTSEAAGWQLTWVERRRGIVRLTEGSRSQLALVEGSGSDWFVTLRGRRIPVTVQSWRERVLAEARLAAAERGGPVEVRSTLPGLVVAVNVAEGAEVGEGEPLLTIEAMKMQNEVRAPRAGRVAQVAVSPGQTVATGVLLVRLD